MTKNIHQHPLINNLAPIVTLNAAEAKEFSRVLVQLNSFEDFSQIVIRDSIINQPLTDTGVYVQTDLSKLIGQNKNLSILLRNEELKTIKKMMESGPTSISYDPDLLIYHIITDHQQESINAIEVDDSAIQAAPVFDAKDFIGLEVPVSDLKDLKNYIGKSSFVKLFIYQNQLEQANVIERDTPYTFKKAGAGSLVGKTPDQVLLCRAFLTVAEKNLFEVGSAGSATVVNHRNKTEFKSR